MCAQRTQTRLQAPSCLTDILSVGGKLIKTQNWFAFASSIEERECRKSNHMGMYRTLKPAGKDSVPSKHRCFITIFSFKYPYPQITCRKIPGRCGGRTLEDEGNSLRRAWSKNCRITGNKNIFGQTSSHQYKAAQSQAGLSALWPAFIFPEEQIGLNNKNGPLRFSWV